MMNSAVISDFFKIRDAFKTAGEKRRSQDEYCACSYHDQTPDALTCLRYSLRKDGGKRLAILQFRNSINEETE